VALNYFIKAVRRHTTLNLPVTHNTLLVHGNVIIIIVVKLSQRSWVPRRNIQKPGKISHWSLGPPKI